MPGEEAQLLIIDWNDFTATSAEVVTTALRAAADNWDQLHPEESR